MIKIKLFGGRAVAAKFDNLSDKLNNMRPAHLQAAVVLDGWIQRNFKAEGGLHKDASLKWKPLSPITKNLRRGEEPFKILQDTGRLKTGWDIFATSKSGFVKSRVTYSSLHEKGGTSVLNGKSFKVPQRKIFPTIKQGGKIVLPVYQRYIRKQI